METEEADLGEVEVAAKEEAEAEARTETEPFLAGAIFNITIGL